MPWGIVYHRAADGSVPAEQFLDACPQTVETKILASLAAVRDAPPPSFSGGGLWQAMHGDMGGFYEIRVIGPGRLHYRLFCVLENGDGAHLLRCGLSGPQIVLLMGLSKPNATLFSARDYARVRPVGEAYRAAFPRLIAI